MLLIQKSSIVSLGAVLKAKMLPDNFIDWEMRLQQKNQVSENCVVRKKWTVIQNRSSSIFFVSIKNTPEWCINIFLELLVCVGSPFRDHALDNLNPE